MTNELNKYSEKVVDVPRIKFGNKQTIETMISEERLLLAKYLRSEVGNWVPLIAMPLKAEAQ